MWPSLTQQIKNQIHIKTRQTSPNNIPTFKSITTMRPGKKVTLHGAKTKLTTT